MYKLLRAGFFRLRKEVIFWLFIFLSIGIAGFVLLKNSSYNEVTLDKVLNELILYIGLFIAIFVSIFVGKEYSEGIIRNKIIIGHSRISIYLSKLIISAIASILAELVFIITVLLIGTQIFGKLQMPLSQFAMSIANTILVIIVYCSIYNFVTIICQDITVATVINILIFITMFIVEGYFGYIANYSKYITNTL